MPRNTQPGQNVEIRCDATLGNYGHNQQKDGEVIIQFRQKVSIFCGFR